MHPVLFLHNGQSVAPDASPAELWQPQAKVRLLDFVIIPLSRRRVTSCSARRLATVRNARISPRTVSRTSTETRLDSGRKPRQTTALSRAAHSASPRCCAGLISRPPVTGSPASDPASDPVPTRVRRPPPRSGRYTRAMTPASRPFLARYDFPPGPDGFVDS